MTGSPQVLPDGTRDLDAVLRGAKPADGSCLEELRQRIRLGYLDGAEGWTRQHIGRGLTADELRSIVGRSPDLNQ